MLVSGNCHYSLLLLLTSVNIPLKGLLTVIIIIIIIIMIIIIIIINVMIFPIIWSFKAERSNFLQFFIYELRCLFE